MKSFFLKVHAAKTLICFALLLALMAALLTTSGTIDVGAKNKNILRLHVIANSDSEYDQALKLEVRDAVLNSNALNFKASISANDSEKSILTRGDALSRAVESVLGKAMVDYSFEMRLGKYDFPQKTYAHKTYAAGEYEALKIVLGEGKGQNWWCVIYPPLCIVETTPDQTNGKDEREFDSLILRFFNWLKEVFKGENEDSDT